MSEIEHFNIRVYAIIFNNSLNAVLVSHEFALGMKMVKFPGGGMHFGEGTIDCIKREAIEEFGQEIEVLGHFYTTDFFQKALFYDNHQLISIYYKARFVEQPRFKIHNNFKLCLVNETNNQSFCWVPLNDITPKLFTFPIDKKVAEMLIA